MAKNSTKQTSIVMTVYS